MLLVESVVEVLVEDVSVVEMVMDCGLAEIGVSERKVMKSSSFSQRSLYMV